MTDPAPGALAGRRVVELGDGPGDYCAKLFADLGADVIKVEPPGGSRKRYQVPFLEDRPGPDRSLPFLYKNTSKRGVTLDVETDRGGSLLRALIATADVVVESFAVGYLESIGLGYKDLSAVSPRLVVTSISGFGQDGPRSGWRSCDLAASALGGAMHVIGDGADPPVRLAGEQADMMAATYAAVSTMIAVLHASATGRGQHVDIAAQETTASVAHICGVGKWLDDGLVSRRMGTSLFASVPSGAYRCKDGLLYLMVNRPAHWKELARWVNEVTGNAEVLDPMFEGPSSNRIAHRELLDVYIGDMLATLSVAEAYHEGQRRHIAMTPVATASDVVGDEHLAARGYFVDVSHADGKTLRFAGAPYRHARTPWRVFRAPRVGEHNDAVFGDELGLSSAQRAELAAAGVV